jgi:CheY-like chemotaxis protein
MPRGGRLTISTALERRSLGGAPEGEVVTIRVQDTGRGMDDATRERLFEPFFTTKDVGEGTGLGLATVYGVIRQSGGHIEVDSEPGAGATFSIFFPRAGGAAATDDPSTRPQSKAPRGETILVVEDDAQLRRLATSILGKSGYRVLEASSGDEALQLMAAWSGRVDLLLTDVIMPGMSGPVLARRLATLRPGLRTLFMSGYTADALSDYRTIDGDMDLLAKPFTADSLVRRVREALDRAKTG